VTAPQATRPGQDQVLVAHQPAYLPWCGYFSRLADVSRLVLLDHVQFSERGRQHRNVILGTAGTPAWLTVPVLRRFGQPISEVRVDNARPWARTHWRTLRQAYGRAPYWDDYAGQLAALYGRPWTWLTDLDIAMTRLLLDGFGLDVQVVRSTALRPAGARTGMLADLCRLTATRVLRVGTGATSYLDHAQLAATGISVEVTTYASPPYPQRWQPFTPGLSALDLLLNCGPRAAGILRAGTANQPWTGKPAR
jgi:hypothetical protein